MGRVSISMEDFWTKVPVLIYRWTSGRTLQSLQMGSKFSESQWM